MKNNQRERGNLECAEKMMRLGKKCLLLIVLFSLLCVNVKADEEGYGLEGAMAEQAAEGEQSGSPEGNPEVRPESQEIPSENSEVRPESQEIPSGNSEVQPESSSGNSEVQSESSARSFTVQPSGTGNNETAAGLERDGAESVEEAGITAMDAGEESVFSMRKSSGVEITGYDADRGIFRVAVSGIAAGDGVKEVLVPVWSKENGQDDIIWYRAGKSSGGDYYVDVDIRNHGYSMGTYYIHVYITDTAGRQYFAGSCTQEVRLEKGTLTVTKSNEREYIVELTGVKVPGGVRQIQFPVWSKENGQDDIMWYTASKLNEQAYRCKISVTNHKGLGQFFVHAYAEMPGGSKIFLGANGFATEAPSVGSVKTYVTNKSGGQFQVRISGVNNSGLIRQIQVPTWSESNQGDLVWYTASKDSNGEYVVNANISNHKYNCNRYNVHVYVMDITGAQRFAGAAVCEMGLGFQSLRAEDISGTEGRYRITLEGLEVPGREKGVQFAVWGLENGQNDIRWYQAAKQSGGKYVCDVKIADHKESGKYAVHGYCSTQGNTLCFIGAAGFEVSRKSMAAQVQVTDMDGTAGTFKVTVKGVASVSGIDKVQVPVWCSNDQSDIVWYTASKASEGVYTVKVKVSQHGNHFGTYKIHVYVTSGNGVQTLAGGTSAAITPHNYVYSRSISNTQREVGIMGVSAGRVQFPTWSIEKGQDDIVWYEGSNRGNGHWSVVVNSGNHRHSGEYTTHIYANKAYVGAASYQLTKSGIDISDIIRNAGMPAGKTLYVWGGGWNEADTAAGETAKTIGLYPEWEPYFNRNRQGYSYLPGKRAWERGERQWRFYGLDCSGYLGWIIYNSVQSGRSESGYVVDASRFASSLSQYGYGTASSCTPNSTFKPGDIISISGHCYLSLGQCGDGSVLLIHSTPNGGVQVSGTVNGGGSSEASRLAGSFMKQNYPQWWSSFGGEGRQSVDASKYLNGTKFSWSVNNLVGDAQGMQKKSANEVLNYLR